GYFFPQLLFSHPFVPLVSSAAPFPFISDLIIAPSSHSDCWSNSKHNLTPNRLVTRYNSCCTNPSLYFSFPSTNVRLYSGKEEMAAAIAKWRTLATYLQSDLYFHRLQCRFFLNNGPDTVEELLDRHVAKKEKKSYNDDEDEKLTRQRLTSTRREVLGLYRDIIRATRFFMWPDSHGVLWRDVLRANARKEFEEARFEKDPEIITRLLIGGHDAVQGALDKLVEKQRQQIAKEKEDRGSITFLFGNNVFICTVVAILVRFLANSAFL
ncbi:Complex 1 LYR protein, partial [Cynara cardunculus var. scolymus]